MCLIVSNDTLTKQLTLTGNAYDVLIHKKPWQSMIWLHHLCKSPREPQTIFPHTQLKTEKVVVSAPTFIPQNQNWIVLLPKEAVG